MNRLLSLLSAGLLLTAPVPARGQDEAGGPLLRRGDRVAWVGSSSTNIGVWPKTMEFLLRTRHPELELTFKKFSTGGGTFATGLQHLDKWLGDFRPTVVVFNYGSNDAGAGEKGLPTLRENAERCVAKARAAGARVLFTTFQAADVRKTGDGPARNRRLYAEELLALAGKKGWPIVDVFHPLDALQKEGERADPAYTILRDNIHLTDPAYIGWGFFLYDGLRLPGGVSSATLGADGSVREVVGCRLSDVRADGTGLSFERADAVLPILPPGPLPPRALVPLEKDSAYRLAVAGLAEGTYEITCEGKTLGTATARQLAQGVNLNTRLLDSGAPAPWAELARQLWAGQETGQVGATRWQFAVRRK